MVINYVSKGKIILAIQVDTIPYILSLKVPHYELLNGGISVELTEFSSS